ncbi:MAG: rod shape-determining protein MreC [Clostridiales bacterium]|nr:rod shape-determining protein MreC [Clostridiales bacterium]
MKDFLFRRWIVILLTAVLLSLIMGILSVLSGGRVSPVSSLVNILTAPLQKGITTVTDKIQNVSDYFFRYDALVEENNSLKNELKETKDLIREAEKYIKENEQLRAALGMKERDKSFDIEPSEVVARSEDNWSVSFTIDKGSLAGIKPDNCVVTSEGMVGYISEVGPTWATVTAITDTSMEASAIVTRTRDVACAEGDFELMKHGLFKLTYLTKETQLLKGDTVETSGMGGLFPKGIVLGYVEEVKTESHGISKYAIVSPAVNLEKVNHVLVIKSFTITE